MANCSWRTFFGFGSLVGATAVLIVAMSGLGWRYHGDNGVDARYGLKAYRWDFRNGNSKTGNIRDLDAGFQYLDQAGDIPLGLGIVACFFAVVGMLLILLHLFRPNTPQYRHFRRIGIFLNFVCGIFTLLAIILYAKKFYVGYSFILYIFCAFLCYIGTTFLLSHAFTNNAPFTSRKTVTTTTTTSSTPAPATHEMGVYNENQA